MPAGGGRCEDSCAGAAGVFAGAGHGHADREVRVRQGGAPGGRAVVAMVASSAQASSPQRLARVVFAFAVVALAHLAAGLDRERALDAGEALGDGLEVLEPLDVGVHRLAAGARPRGADGVGDLDDRRLQAGVFDLLVVGGDRVDDLGRQVVALGDRGADGGVRALDLVVDRLADVVEEAAHLGDLDVGADLGGDDRGQVAGLDDVVEHVLAVARPELEPAERLDDVGREARDAGVVGGLLAGLAHDRRRPRRGPWRRPPRCGRGGCGRRR